MAPNLSSRQLGVSPSSVCRGKRTKLGRSRQKPASHRDTSSYQQKALAPKPVQGQQHSLGCISPSALSLSSFEEYGLHGLPSPASSSGDSYLLTVPANSPTASTWTPFHRPYQPLSEQTAVSGIINQQSLTLPTSSHLDLTLHLGYTQKHLPMAAMVHQAPSPSANESEQFGLHHLEAFNRKRTSPARITGPDGGVYLASTHNDSQSQGLQQSMHTNSPNPFVGYEGLQSPGSGIHNGSYDRKHDDLFAPASDSSTKEDSVPPLTPSSASSDLVKRTRSGRVIADDAAPQILRSNTGAKVSKARSSRPSRSKSKSSSDHPLVDRPLSELTKDMDIPVRDMEAYAHRPTEERLADVAKRNGRVPRPMNAFMLYRSAYSERTKAWCVQNNHQIVSQVSGQSWKLEPDGVQGFYNELAKVERDNHQLAHPDYKFSPSKNGPASRKKKLELSEDEDSDLSDIGDGDAAYRPGGRRTRRQTRDDYSMSPFDNNFDHSYHTPTFNPQQWDMHGSQHFPGAFDTPAQHQMPYFQQQTQQPYLMQSPGFMDMPVQMQDNFFDMNAPSSSSYSQHFPNIHDLQLHDGMGQQMHNSYEPQQVRQAHPAQQHNADHVDPNLLMQSNNLFASEHDHLHNQKELLGTPHEQHDFGFDMQEWMPEEHF